MNNRFRIEIYDDVKSNDITLFSQNRVDRDLLNEHVFSNIRNFSSTVRAYVFDNVTKKKVAAMFLPMETVQLIKSKTNSASKGVGLT